MQEINYQEPKEKSSKTWVIILLILIILAIAFVLIWYFLFKNKSATPTATPSNEILQKNSVEKWVRSPNIVIKITTSTDTHKLKDGIYRMYLLSMDKGIVYSDSSNAESFDDFQSTGITVERNKMISNPAVIELKDNSYIMIYEERPISGNNPETKRPPGPETQRNLMVALSSDGKKFTQQGIAIDSSKEDNYFASVPDLVLLPDGKIRMYYVSGGEAIGSAISSDGITWAREEGYRLEEKAVDPDVLYKIIDGKQKWVMYYSVLTGPGNKIYKSVSANGLKWETGQEALFPYDKNSTIVDPDVFEIDNNNYRMFFGEARGTETQTEAPVEFDLYSANSDRDIFDY